MPFVNNSQRKACFAQYKREIDAGRLPSWNCYEWAEKKKSPSKKSPKRRSRSSVRKLPKRKVHIGPRGGKYIILDGRKIYI